MADRRRTYISSVKASKSSSCRAAPQLAWRAGSWQALVRGSGVAALSVAQIQQGLDAGTYDEGIVCSDLLTC